MSKNNLSKDSLATLLICTRLGMSKSKNNLPKPYTLTQWNKLVNKLVNSNLERPSAFFETKPDYWRKELNLTEDQIDRLEQLLSRGGQLGIELERLDSLGIWVTTRAEKTYPTRFKNVLKHKSPIVLYCAGDIKILKNEGVAIVGSRNVSDEGRYFAKKLAKRCAKEGLTVISGGARGVDSISQDSSLTAGGTVVSIFPQGLESQIRSSKYREAILDRKLIALSTYHPKSSWAVYRAMERNKYVYALSKFTVVVESSLNKGGTWSGATENLDSNWVPLFVRSEDNISPGNQELINRGGLEITEKVLYNKNIELVNWFKSKSKDFIKTKSSTSKISADKTKNEVQIKLNLNNSTKDMVEMKKNSIDLFEVVWPYFKKVLKTPKTKDELSNIFNLETSQVTAWIQRGLEDDIIKKDKDSNKYVVISNSNN